MKKIMMAATLALCCAAMADEPKRENGRPGPWGEAMRDPIVQQRENGRPGPWGEAMRDPIVQLVSRPKMAEKLGLTEEQQAKIKELSEAQRKDAKENQQKLQAAMEKQFELLKAEKVDEAAVMAAIEETFERRKIIAKAQAKRLIGIKAVLTPEQVSKALELTKMMRKAARRAGDAPKAGRPGKPGRGGRQAPCAEGCKGGACPLRDKE